MEKITTEINTKAIKELMKPYIGFFFFSIGFALLMGLVYVLVSFSDNSWGNPFHVVLIVLTGVIFLFSFLFLSTYFTTVKRASLIERTMVYEFLDEHFIVEGFKGDEKIEEVKHLYSETQGYRLSKNYIFLLLDAGGFLPITRSEELISFLKEKGIKETKSFAAKAKKK